MTVGKSVTSRTYPLLSGSFVQKVALKIGLPVIAVLMVAGAESFFGNRPATQEQTLTLRSAGYGPRTYEDALERANLSVESHRDRVAQADDEWLRQEGLARSLHRRSQLTGSFADLAEAVAQTKRAMAVAPEGSGPMLTRASVAMSSHDLVQSEIALNALQSVAVPPEPELASEIIALRGDLAFYRGDPAGAARAYRAADALAPSAGTAIRLARLEKSRGEFDSAQTWLLKGARRGSTITPEFIAGIGLQIGAIDLARGDYAAAQIRFTEVNDVFPGHWLIEAHLAQSKALAGDLDGAIALLRELATRTQSPDLADSLANMLRAAGREEESREWIERSAAIWDARMARLPEAAVGHALEHELAFGSPDRSVELAQQNLVIRPWGGAHLLMAQAYRKAGEFELAQTHIEKAKSVGIHSAALYAAESEILTVLGQLARAKSARARAKALNPRIFDPETAFIWFSHG